MKRLLSTNVIALMLVGGLLTSPYAAQAQTPTYPYEPQTPGEQLAFLYGMIYQLQLLLGSGYVADRADDDGDIGVPRPGRSGEVDVDTLAARDIEDDEATLRAEIDLNGEDEAEVWFAYGRDDDDLDDESRVVRVTDSRGDRRTVSITIDDLRDDTRYYFRAIAEDERGDRSYGDIRSFRTDDAYYDHDDGDFSLRVSDTTIDEYDEIEVEWEVPRDEESSTNWIGLYERNASNRDYEQWKYLTNDDEGTLTFRIRNDGEYVFRLFLNNSYDDEIESPVIYVD
ncbi:MAG: hypothetical protein ACOC4E_00705 [Patescibacteria group bacterium]